MPAGLSKNLLRSRTMPKFSLVYTGWRSGNLTCISWPMATKRSFVSFRRTSSHVATSTRTSNAPQTAFARFAEISIPKVGGIAMPRIDELTCRFCGADSRCKVEEVYLRPRTPPMFCVRCYNCGRAGKPKGTKKTAIRAWKKTK